MDNIFLEYYDKTKKELNKYINNFNKELINEDNELLKEQLELFSNLNSDGKLIRGILVNLGYKLLNEDTSYSYPLDTDVGYIKYKIKKKLKDLSSPFFVNKT